MKNNALEYFTAVPKQHNCAQAVSAGAGREDLVSELASCGGGRAPDGLCGALYSALMLISEDKRNELECAFSEAAGAVRCCDIKAKSFPCTECVRIAAELTEKYL